MFHADPKLNKIIIARKIRNGVVICQYFANRKDITNQNVDYVTKELN